MKQVVFRPATKTAEQLLSPPVPANGKRPSWYSRMPLFVRGQKTFGLIQGQHGMIPNTTLRACMPFKEALTLGYLVLLEADLLVTKKENGFDFSWSVETDLVSSHSPEQAPGLPEPFDGKPGVMKWSNEYTFSTPKGYSALYTHPMNRHDLPFRTFSGVVETDRYPLPVQFPFQMLDFSNDSLIIPKGTPVAQIMPFKRDNFESSLVKANEEETRKAGFVLHSLISSAYKTLWWVKKTYR
jgi:hypothetical protein